MYCIGRWTVDELKDLIALLQQADFENWDILGYPGVYIVVNGLSWVIPGASLQRIP